MNLFLADKIVSINVEDCIKVKTEKIEAQGKVIETDEDKIVIWDVSHRRKILKINDIQSYEEFDYYHGHDYVDLGLPSGLKWATCNLGASQPWESGDSYAWGEIKPKKEGKYKWSDETGKKIIKYCISSKYGKVDGKNKLDREDDAVIANWGYAWRMPTWREIKEMYNGCYWECVSTYKGNEIVGQLGTSKKNGESIFFPFEDITFEGLKMFPYNLFFRCYRSSVSTKIDYIDGDILPFRESGQSIRPVAR